MILEEMSYDVYCDRVIGNFFYNMPEFNNLNSGKVDRVRYFVFKDNRYRFALCVGETDRFFQIPFSAPFASFVPIRENWKLQQLDDAVRCFDDFAKMEKINQICFVLPPAIYGTTLVSSLQNCLFRHGYTMKQIELSFSIFLKVSNESYLDALPSNGRKNLVSAMRNPLIKIFPCSSIREKKLAYDIIAQNRKWKGYPLRMSWDQVAETIRIVPHDFFIVSSDGRDIAAAVVFQVTKDIVQVIYWGDVPGVSEFRPMNYLAFRLMQYYRDKGMKYLDIGPSTENGVPNYGLCDFKRSIGCEVSAKFVMEKKF